MKRIEEIAVTRHLTGCKVTGWQIVRGALDRWYLIEQHPEGYWLQREGPYRSRQEARYFFS